jgi:hypothetical protein
MHHGICYGSYTRESDAIIVAEELFKKIDNNLYDLEKQNNTLAMIRMFLNKTNEAVATFLATSFALIPTKFPDLKPEVAFKSGIPLDIRYFKYFLYLRERKNIECIPRLCERSKRFGLRIPADEYLTMYYLYSGKTVFAIIPDECLDMISQFLGLSLK